MPIRPSGLVPHCCPDVCVEAGVAGPVKFRHLKKKNKKKKKINKTSVRARSGNPWPSETTKPFFMSYFPCSNDGKQPPIFGGIVRVISGSSHHAAHLLLVCFTMGELIATATKNDVCHRRLAPLLSTKGVSAFFHLFVFPFNPANARQDRLGEGQDSYDPISPSVD